MENQNVWERRVAGLFQTLTPPAFALLGFACGGGAVDTRYFLRGEVDVANADEQFTLMYASSWLHERRRDRRLHRPAVHRRRRAALTRRHTRRADLLSHAV